MFVWRSLLDAINIFKISIRPLFNKCKRKLHFLDQLTRLGWYDVYLEQYLGILVLIDTVEAARRFDLLTQVSEVREEAEHESFNVLRFGMESTYTIHGFRKPASTTKDFPKQCITASLISIDPYPNHVVDIVLLMDKGISCQYREGKVNHTTYSNLFSTLHKALGQLTQSSKSVHTAREELERSLGKGIQIAAEEQR